MIIYAQILNHFLKIYNYKELIFTNNNMKMKINRIFDFKYWWRNNKKK